MIRRVHASQRSNVVPIRRRSLKHRRRHLLSRWLKPLAGAVVIVGLPVLSIGWFVTAPHFALAEVEVEVGDQVAKRWVRQTLAPFMGRNLLWLDLAHLDHRLGRHPWVHSVGLRKELPDRLTVRVVERRAMALLRQRDGLFYLDEKGEVIGPFEPQKGPADLVIVSRREPGADGIEPRLALAFIAELESSRPEWARGLSEVEIVGQDDFWIFSSSLPFPLLLRTGNLTAKADRLEPLLPQIAARYPTIEAVDLRFSQRIIVQPFAADSNTSRHHLWKQESAQSGRG